MPTYSVAHISAIIHAKALLPQQSYEISYLLTDSRQLVHAEKTLFFALVAAKDGHAYIPDLYAAGVRNFVVSNSAHIGDYPEANFLIVSNTLDALQQLAAHHRSQFTYPVIGITGSNGKTIVKEWLYQLLSPDYTIVRSPKSYNSQIGVPLSVWQMSDKDTLALFEAGISKPGEMERLAAIIKPDIGVLTAIGEAHDQDFTSREQKVNEKYRLFTHASKVIDFPINDLQEIETVIHKQQATIKVLYQNTACAITIPFTDKAAIANAITCWRVLLYLGCEQDVITERMLQLHPIAMRLELKQGINNCSLINDSYSSDLNSLRIALDFLNQQQQHKHKTIILSDMLQTGKPDAELYQTVADLLKNKGINRVIGIGEAIAKQAAFFPSSSMFYPSTAAFVQAIPELLFRDETILLKGARTFAFEQITKLLEQKAHDTVLEVNLNALVHNLGYYRALLQPKTKIMAMVKAFSYGSGSYEIANLLQFHHVDYLAVAYADEGVALRKAGITLPIMVMSPEESTFEAIIAYNLEPELYSSSILESFEATLARYGRTKYPVHIKLDTGMRRLGFEEERIVTLAQHLKNTTYIHVKTIFSHLAASEDSAHDAFTQQQLALFLRMSAAIMQEVSYPVDLHIANTAAVTRFPEAQLDMVRLGIGLYGVQAAGNENLQQVAALKTTVSQLKTVPVGTTIGYGRKGKVTRATTIATVKIGYADGLFRSLSNGKGYMCINNQPAPIIGNVCMDMCMLDVTDLQVAEGDEVVVFGGSPTIEEVAEAAGTISYELLTSVSQRVKRVYYYE